MPFRTKLLLMSLALTAVTMSVAIYFMASDAEVIAADEKRAKMVSIAASAAVSIDPALVTELRERDDESKPAYRALETVLRRVRDANRREDAWVQNIYLVRESPERKGVHIFLVDPDEDFTKKAHLGDVVHSTHDAPSLSEIWVSSDKTADQWGEWLTAIAPVRDGSGTAIAGVRVDAPYSRISVLDTTIRHRALLALAVGFGVAAIAGIFMSRYVSRPLHSLRETIVLIGQGNLDAPLAIDSADEFGDVARAISGMQKGLRERDAVKSTFARFVSQHVLDSVLSSGQLPNPKGARRKVTVLFLDVRGFTSFSEKLRPEDVVSILNEIFEKVVDIIFKNNGSLDKFIGDGLMALFGVPLEDPYQEENAIKSAAEIQAAVGAMSVDIEARFGFSVKVGIGINSGNAIVGTVGSSRRMEYTAIGDTVNLASRLETATKEHGVGILMSEYTYNGMRGSFPVRSVGSVTVKGRAEAVTAYTIEPLSSDPAQPA